MNIKEVLLVIVLAIFITICIHGAMLLFYAFVYRPSDTIIRIIDIIEAVIGATIAVYLIQHYSKA